MLNNLQSKTSLNYFTVSYALPRKSLFNSKGLENIRSQNPGQVMLDVTVLNENTMPGEDLTSKLLLKDQLYFKW